MMSEHRVKLSWRDQQQDRLVPIIFVVNSTVIVAFVLGKQRSSTSTNRPSEVRVKNEEKCGYFNILTLTLTDMI